MNRDYDKLVETEFYLELCDMFNFTRNAKPDQLILAISNAEEGRKDAMQLKANETALESLEGEIEELTEENEDLLNKYNDLTLNTEGFEEQISELIDENDKLESTIDELRGKE